MAFRQLCTTHSGSITIHSLPLGSDGVPRHQLKFEIQLNPVDDDPQIVAELEEFSMLNTQNRRVGDDPPIVQTS